MKCLMATVWCDWQSNRRVKELMSAWRDGKKNVSQSCALARGSNPIFSTQTPDHWNGCEPLQCFCVRGLMVLLWCLPQGLESCQAALAIHCNVKFYLQKYQVAHMPRYTYLRFSVLTEGIQWPGCGALHQRSLTTTHGSSLGVASVTMAGPVL